MEQTEKKRHGVTYYVDSVTKRKLDQLALDNDTTVTALIKRAVSLLFEEMEKVISSK